MERYIIGYHVDFRKHLTGRESEPVAPQPSVDADRKTMKPIPQKDIDTYDLAMDVYSYNESCICGIITSSIPERLQNRIGVMEKTTAFQMWTKLCQLYGNQSILVQADLIAQLFSISCGDGDPLKTIDEVMQKSNEVVAAGCKLDDAYQAAAMIRAMPREYHPTIQTHITTAVSTGQQISLETLVTHLTESIKLDQAKEKRERDMEAAMAARFKGVNHRVNSKPGSEKPTEPGGAKDGVECYNCGGTGHFSRVCPSKKSENPKRKRKGKAKKAQQTEQAIESKIEEVDDYALSLAPAMGLKASSGGVIRLIDSAASHHFDPDASNFVNLKPCTPRAVEAATGQIVYARKSGTIRFTYKHNGQVKTMDLPNVYYMPELPSPLLSVSCLRESGLIFSNPDRGWGELRKEDGQLVLRLREEHNVYPLTTWNPASARSAMDVLTLTEAHNNFGHASAQTIKTAAKDGLFGGVMVNVDSPINDCEACVLGRARRKQITKTHLGSRTNAIGDLVYADTWGPAQVVGHGGYRYFVMFIDERSRLTSLFLLKSKEAEEVLAKFKTFEALLKTQYGATIKAFHSDRGGEFLNNAFDRYFESKGIKRSLTTHDTPEHNGIVERANYTVVDLARTVLADSKLPKKLWTYAMMYAVWIKNRMPTKVLAKDNAKTPYEFVTKEKPDMSKAHRWGSRVFVRVKKEPKSKLNARGAEARWIGPSTETLDGSIIYWPSSGKVSIERDFRFLDWNSTDAGEKELEELEASVELFDSPIGSIQRKNGLDTNGNSPKTTTNDAPSSNIASESILTSLPSIADTSTSDPVARTPSNAGTSPATSQNVSNDVVELLEGIDSGDEGVGDGESDGEVKESPRRSTRKRVAVERGLPKTVGQSRLTNTAIGSSAVLSYAKSAMARATGIPQSLNEAMDRDDWLRWKEAMDAEMDKIMSNRTYDLVDRGEAKGKAIPLQWVFDYKVDSNGNIIKYKARIVARGDKQQLGVNYDHTTSPVIRSTTKNLLLALAAKKGVAHSSRGLL